MRFTKTEKKNAHKLDSALLLAQCYYLYNFTISNFYIYRLQRVVSSASHFFVSVSLNLISRKMALVVRT